MTIIDCQVHAYEANTPKRPWHSVPNWPDHVTGDEMVAAMHKVGVDGAIFISAFGLYQFDASTRKIIGSMGVCLCVCSDKGRRVGEGCPRLPGALVAVCGWCG